jgi:tetrahydromethanopterin S-methyltransferase subunit F
VPLPATVLLPVATGVEVLPTTVPVVAGLVSGFAAGLVSGFAIGMVAGIVIFIVAVALAAGLVSGFAIGMVAGIVIFIAALALAAGFGEEARVTRLHKKVKNTFKVRFSMQTIHIALCAMLYN